MELLEHRIGVGFMFDKQRDTLNHNLIKMTVMHAEVGFWESIPLLRGVEQSLAS